MILLILFYVVPFLVLGLIAKDIYSDKDKVREKGWAYGLSNKDDWSFAILMLMLPLANVFMVLCILYVHKQITGSCPAFLKVKNYLKS
jgi:hypothetical protein